MALRRGTARREAILALAVCGAFLAYNSAYFLPFGGWVPGPRFLVPILPFLAIGIAAAVRAAPLTTRCARGALHPRDGRCHTRRAARRARAAASVSGSSAGGSPTSRRPLVTELGGGNGVLAVLPVLVRDRARPRPRGMDAASDGAPTARCGPRARRVLLWAVVAAAGPELLELDRAVGQVDRPRRPSSDCSASPALAWLALRGSGPAAAGGSRRARRPDRSRRRVSLEVGAARRHRKRRDRRCLAFMAGGAAT